MLKQILRLIFWTVTVSIPVLAPLELVAHLINRLTAGIEIIGYASAFGLALSIVMNSFDALGKVQRTARDRAKPKKIAERKPRRRSRDHTIAILIALTIAEGLMSGAEFILRAVENKMIALDNVVASAALVLAVLGIVTVQELTLISGGAGVSRTLEKIAGEQVKRQMRAIRQNSKAAGAPSGKPAHAISAKTAPEQLPSATRGTFRQYELAQMARNGNGMMPARDIVAAYGVPTRTAYNWRTEYVKKHPSKPEKEP